MSDKQIVKDDGEQLLRDFEAERKLARESAQLWRDKLKREDEGVHETRLYSTVYVQLTRKQANAWERYALSSPEYAEANEADDDFSAAEGCSTLTYEDKREKLRAARARKAAAIEACRLAALKWCAENGVEVE